MMFLLVSSILLRNDPSLLSNKTNTHEMFHENKKQKRNNISNLNKISKIVTLKWKHKIASVAQ